MHTSSLLRPKYHVSCSVLMNISRSSGDLQQVTCRHGDAPCDAPLHVGVQIRDEHGRITGGLGLHGADHTRAPLPSASLCDVSQSKRWAPCGEAQGTHHIEEAGLGGQVHVVEVGVFVLDVRPAAAQRRVDLQRLSYPEALRAYCSPVAVSSFDTCGPTAVPSFEIINMSWRTH